MAEFVQTTLMDGYAGGPHITEAQLGLAHQATFGPDDYVLEGGRESEAQVLTNNSIRIFDAVYCIQGRRDAIPASGYTDVTINNGTQGMNRNDIIVRRYKKDEVSEEESTEYAVIKGTPSSGEAVDPSVTTGDIRSGAVLHEMKLYRVKLTGLNIVEVEPLFNILKNQATLQKEIAQSNKDLTERLAELNGNYANNVRFIPFTMTPSGTGNSSAFITNIAKINSLFGITDATQQNSGAVIMNGDGNADSLHAEGVTWQGENLYAVFNKNVNGRFRITGLLYYSPAGAITLS